MKRFLYFIIIFKMSCQPLYSFDFPDDVIDNYMTSDCYSLSKELSQSLNTQIFSIYEIATNTKLHPTKDPQHHVISYGPYYIDIVVSGIKKIY